MTELIVVGNERDTACTVCVCINGTIFTYICMIYVWPFQSCESTLIFIIL